MSLSTTKKKLDIIFQDEIEDLTERVNNVELNLIESKEFSHLSSEAFEALQFQINELRSLVENLVLPKESPINHPERLYF